MKDFTFPLVTIIIPFYNDLFVGQALHSALQQTYPQFEIIVVDDGSTQYAERIRPYMDRVHYLGKANGGTASALNHGIKYASGEYIAWLSSDDLFYPDKLVKQLEYMMTWNAYICHTNFDNINGYSQVTQHRAAVTFPSMGEFYQSFFKFNPVNGCTVMMKRELLQYIGNFNEDLPFTHDLDLWYRAILNGFDFHFVDEPFTAYRWHGGMGTMKHGAAIIKEAAETNSRYQPLLAKFLQRMSV
ncbi:glycosyltransferase [Paenibacillus sp. MER TA 81-3]|uniref:glycosyltransferase n=1 Tax=Paenibacillus sp. MER TA 81-3 TaxID=2939573 RepID=UPI00203FEBF6|nr:glycosyltransferase [Paenibacillus sp. MER TA 81-3]MCM3339053.1 glycosyltransferase [Paenibacillus sp. MER TA 81-3]